jgi:hypothetical protein
MSFEAEIKQSIRELHNAIAKVSSETKAANANLRQTQVAFKGVSSGASEAALAARAHAKEVQDLGKAAKMTAGPAKELVERFTGLVSLTPATIAMGAGIGGMVAGVSALVSGVTEASARMAELESNSLRAAKRAGATLREAGRQALLTADPEELRKRGTPERDIPVGPLSDDQLVSLAVSTGKTTEAEARATLAQFDAAKTGAGSMTTSGAVRSTSQAERFGALVGPEISIEQAVSARAAGRSEFARFANAAEAAQEREAAAKRREQEDLIRMQLAGVGPVGSQRETLALRDPQIRAAWDDLEAERKKVSEDRSFISNVKYVWYGGQALYLANLERQQAELRQRLQSGTDLP